MAQVFDVERQLPDITSKDKPIRNLSLKLSTSSEGFPYPAEKLKLYLKTSAPAKLDLSSPKDSTKTANTRFRKIPLKRISGLSKFSLPPSDYSQTFNDKFITYDPYLPRLNSSGNSNLSLRKFEMFSDLEFPHTLINDEAKLELHNSFMSAQKGYYLNRQDKI